MRNRIRTEVRVKDSVQPFSLRRGDVEHVAEIAFQDYPKFISSPKAREDSFTISRAARHRCHRKRAASVQRNHYCNATLVHPTATSERKSSREEVLTDDSVPFATNRSNQCSIRRHPLIRSGPLTLGLDHAKLQTSTVFAESFARCERRCQRRPWPPFQRPLRAGAFSD